MAGVCLSASGLFLGAWVQSLQSSAPVPPRPAPGASLPVSANGPKRLSFTSLRSQTQPASRTCGQSSEPKIPRLRLKAASQRCELLPELPTYPP